MDLTGLFRIWNPRYGTWSVFGQDHLAKVLLGWDTAGASHDAVGDAIKSIRLFNVYSRLQADPEEWQRAQVGRRGPAAAACCAACRTIPLAQQALAQGAAVARGLPRSVSRPGQLSERTTHVLTCVMGAWVRCE